MRVTWKTFFIIAAVVVFGVVGAIAWTRRFPRPQPQLRIPSLIAAEFGPDRLEKQSKEWAGPQGIDCGRVPVRGDPKAATACALAAQKAGKPFRVRYDLQGIDSEVAMGIVRTPAGKVIAISYDGDPSGHWRYGDGFTYPKLCPEPVHLWVNPGGRINCFQQASAPPKDVMSPNLEPY